MLYHISFKKGGYHCYHCVWGGMSIVRSFSIQKIFLSDNLCVHCRLTPSIANEWESMTKQSLSSIYIHMNGNSSSQSQPCMANDILHNNFKIISNIWSTVRKFPLNKSGLSKWQTIDNRYLFIVRHHKCHIVCRHEHTPHFDMRVKELIFVSYKQKRQHNYRRYRSRI